MTDTPLTAEDTTVLAARFREITTDVTDELGATPALADLLDILKWSVPTRSAALDGALPEPCTMTATLTGNTRYRAETASRAAELNDNAFELTREACAELAEKLQRPQGKPATPKEFAAALTQVLQAADLELADATTSRLRRLTPAARKRRITASPGDVVAIPAPGGYRLAVVITRNAFGTALGFFAGTAPVPRASTTILQDPRPLPVYTEESLIKDGSWPIIHHDQDLLAHFPANPEIYHKPQAGPSVVDTGEHGAAETAEGTMRLLDVAEAETVGLYDGTYRQTRTAEHLQQRLAEGADS